MKGAKKRYEIGRQLGDLGLMQEKVAEDYFFRNVRYLFKKDRGHPSFLVYTFSSCTSKAWELPFCATSTLALKGHDIPAQGNALGVRLHHRLRSYEVDIDNNRLLTALVEAHGSSLFWLAIRSGKIQDSLKFQRGMMRAQV